jgi:hypothetical protein
MNACFFHAEKSAPPAEIGVIFDFGGQRWTVRRPKQFVLVFEGVADLAADQQGDYLHDFLLAPSCREAFYDLIDATGLVVCLNLPTSHPSYRDVRGRSSKGRLSQGEYYHHDGCSGPQKPRFVEIRCPYQNVTRSVATAVAPHREVVAAMLRMLPDELAGSQAIIDCAALAEGKDALLDQLQGLITRSVRRSLDAEAAREYFRQVDLAANAYFEPWQLGESRLIANANAGITMQHRRAYQQVNRVGVANGNLLKRWPNEELLLPGQTLDRAFLDAMCSEEDGACQR